MPFSADFPREEGFALGVIGSPGPDFPDTLKQFRALGSTPRADSLSPLQTETDEREAEPEPWRPSRFWASLAIGFGVGAAIAAVLTSRDSPPSSAAPRQAETNPPLAARPALALPPGCAVTSAASPSASALPASAGASASPPTAAKPLVTPRLERRFWLERARTAQHAYRLQDAERFYRRVLSLSPKDSEALSGVGELELLRGSPLLAADRFREALASNPSYLPALVALADLHWQGGEVDAARGAYRNIVEHFEDDAYPPYVKQRLDGEACLPQCP